MSMSEYGYVRTGKRPAAIAGIKRTILPSKYQRPPAAKLEAVSRKWLEKRPRVSIAAIIEAVSAETGVDIFEIKGPVRGQPIVLARHIAAHLAVKHTGLSLPQIGRALNRDHSTVLYADRRVRERRKDSPELEEVIGRIERRAIILPRRQNDGP